MSSKHKIKAVIDDLHKVIKHLEAGGDPGILSDMLAKAVTMEVCDLNFIVAKTAFFQSVLDVIPLAVYYKGTDGRYVACNDHFVKLAGMPKDKVIGATAFDFLYKEDAEEYLVSDTALMKNKSKDVVQHKGRMRPDDDTFYMLHKKIILSPDGSVSGILGIISDVSEHKASEDMAWEGEAFYKSLFERSPIPSVIFDNLHMIEDMNYAAIDLLGAYADHIGRDAADIFCSYSDFEKVMETAGTKTVKVQVKTKGDESVDAVANLVISGVYETEKYIVSFVLLDSVR